MTFNPFQKGHPDFLKGTVMHLFFQFEKKPLFFTNPEIIISCFHSLKLSSAFQEIEQLMDAGYYLAGFLSYEAGYCFEKKLYQNKKYNFPLLHFGAFKKPCSFYLPIGSKTFCLKNIKTNISQTLYANDIDVIREHIELGDVYQITYCLKQKFSFKGNPRALYQKLLQNQPVPYPAYIETDQFNILSLSPERFFKKTHNHIITEPMKGTWFRGKNIFNDMKERWRFQYDTKNRAENVMIADLLRNDLGRIGKRVRAPKLFTVTPYKTLFQMTSTVTAKIPHHISFYELFAALFPSGSVTGAPKIRAMEIIRDIEPEERKIYTGAIGYITPERNCYFNIPIRSLLIDKISGQGEMGVGGGIVWDSTADGEWKEGILKSAFLTSLNNKEEEIFPSPLSFHKNE